MARISSDISKVRKAHRRALFAQLRETMGAMQKAQDWPSTPKLILPELPPKPDISKLLKKKAVKKKIKKKAKKKAAPKKKTKFGWQKRKL